MPFYSSDLYPLMMRALEVLDRRKTLTFEELRERIMQGEFRELIAGNYPVPPIPDTDFQEITKAIKNVLIVNKNSENEHFYIGSNGYCLLVAVLLEIRREAVDNERPNQPREKG